MIDYEVLFEVDVVGCSTTSTCFLLLLLGDLDRPRRCGLLLRRGLLLLLLPGARLGRGAGAGPLSARVVEEDITVLLLFHLLFSSLSLSVSFSFLVLSEVGVPR